jgi:16S rRNA (uracil1498-N3)-methyltransferase
MPLRGDAVPAYVFVPEIPDPGGTGRLDSTERHHVVRVCRAGVGDTVHATDGRGTLATLRLTGVGTDATFEVESREQAVRGARTCLACGVPEGTRADWLVEKLAELGVATFQPLESARERWRWSPARRERLERLTLAALKQSMQTFRLVIEEPVAVRTWLEGLPAGVPRWLADREGNVPGVSPGDPVAIAAGGPAGGFARDEREALLAGGFEPVRLAPGVLRAETAGVALAAWLAR